MTTEGFLVVLAGIKTTRYVRLSSNIVIFYDQLITFDREVNSIWKSRWTFAKCLFLVNRYYGLASAIFNTYAFFHPNLTNSLCSGYYNWEGWTNLIGCILADIILQMRIYALYSKNKPITGLIGGSFILCVAASIGVMTYSTRGLVATAVDILDGTKFCLTPLVPPHYYLVWLPMLAFESLLCVLAVTRAYRSYSSSGARFTGQGLFDILIRDSLLYFLAIGATYLTCFLVWRLEQNILVEAPNGFSLAISCTLGNRMILNLRDANKQEEESGVHIRLKAVSHAR
ncbi:hypothetical protein GALMADRAFT_253439 [Galerina marginata CBS 339.88]|uniref:DUF6533 domain-containing protein n=1 Tax=Galerina marginata (strain CBS 339.88) TaxID=685588 RepID=A0A067SNU9_GALM3|nr:hypothetical protein GALMADRAFT_253439 [Galerina marginata CBS 339.88]